MKCFENPRMRVLDFRLNIIGTYQSRRAELQHTFNRAVCLEMVLRHREKRKEIQEAVSKADYTGDCVNCKIRTSTTLPTVVEYIKVPGDRCFLVPNIFQCSTYVGLSWK